MTINAKRISVLILLMISFGSCFTASAAESPFRKLFFHHQSRAALAPESHSLYKVLPQQPLMYLKYQYTGSYYKYIQTVKLHYNKSGLIDTLTAYDTATGRNIYAVGLKYDKKGRETQELYYTAKPAGAGFNFPKRKTFLYDSLYGEVYTSSEGTKDGKTFYNIFSYAYHDKLDAQGRLLERATLTKDSAQSAFDTISLAVMTWPATKGAGYLDSLTYNYSAGKRQLNYLYRSAKIVWLDFSKHQIKRSTYQIYQPASKTWKDTAYDSYTWSGNDYVLTDSVITASGNQPLYRTIYESGPYGSSVVYNLDYISATSSFDTSYRTITTYNSKGEQLLYTFEQNNGSGLEIQNGFKNTFVDDVNGNHLVNEVLYWSTKDMQFTKQLKYVYRSYITVNAVEEAISAPASGISIYPNPAANELNIRMAHPMESTLISIRSLSGSLIYQQSTHAAQIQTIDLSSVAVGMYLIEISSPAGSQFHKFIKR